VATRISTSSVAAALWLLISAALVVASVAILLTRGLNFGIEFRGGVQIQAPIGSDGPLEDASDLDVIEDVRAALADLASTGVRTVAFGDIHLGDVRAYREEQLAAAGMRATFPLWGEDTSVLATRFIAEGHRATVVCVDTQVLAPTFCGRDYDAAFIADLPGDVDGFLHVCAEPGASRPTTFRNVDRRICRGSSS
jgi:diphthamide synthase (EF-2-diphthine--ammonia ligase)